MNPWRRLTPCQTAVTALACISLFVVSSGMLVCLLRWGRAADLAVLIVAATLFAVTAIWLLMDLRAARYDHAFLLGYRLRDMDDASEPPPARKLRLIDLSS